MWIKLNAEDVTIGGIYGRIKWVREEFGHKDEPNPKKRKALLKYRVFIKDCVFPNLLHEWVVE